jgi:RNA polymerase sigma-70 factor, ECF subfamily
VLCSGVLHGGDAPVIETAARGAWPHLEAKLRPFVARRLRSSTDVDDVLQEVFLRIQRGLVSLHDQERFGSWVYRIARNAIVDHQRAATKHPFANGEAGEALVAALEDDDDLAARALASCLAPFVAQLASPYREALTLVELEGLSQREAAEMIGVSLSGMKSRVQRGRAQLRDALEACCHIALDVRGHVVGWERREDAHPPDGCCASAPQLTSRVGVLEAPVNGRSAQSI